MARSQSCTAARVQRLSPYTWSRKRVTAPRPRLSSTFIAARGNSIHQLGDIGRPLFMARISESLSAGMAALVSVGARRPAPRNRGRDDAAVLDAGDQGGAQGRVMAGIRAEWGHPPHSKFHTCMRCIKNKQLACGLCAFVVKCYRWSASHHKRRPAPDIRLRRARRRAAGRNNRRSMGWARALSRMTVAKFIGAFALASKRIQIVQQQRRGRRASPPSCSKSSMRLTPRYSVSSASAGQARASSY